MVEYNSELCKHLHKENDTEHTVLFTKLAALEKSVNGNGRTGLAARVEALWSWYQKQTASRAGLLDWAFRIGITIILTYIAAQVGLK